MLKMSRYGQRNKCRNCKELFNERPRKCTECGGYHCGFCAWSFQHICDNCSDSTRTATQATENKYLELCREVESLREKLNAKSIGQSMLIKFYESVLEDVMCAVCLETLTPPVKMCINGHAVCAECKDKLIKCPTCHNYFSNVKMASLLQNILKALPRKCEYEKCGEYYSQGDAHKEFCGYRPTVCKLCNWAGPCLGVISHLILIHPDCMLHTEINTVVLLENFDVKRESVRYLPFFVDDKFFWITMTNNPSTETLKLSFYVIRCNKLDSKTNVQIELKSEQDKSIIKRTLDNDFSVGFHSSVIESCVNNNGHLEIGINFNRSQ